MASTGQEGMVFVSYAHADRARVQPLVERLKRHFQVWWDEDLPLAAPWRSALTEQLATARCVIVMWTRSSVTRDFVRREVRRAHDRGVLLQVKLDAGASIPRRYIADQHLELSGWTGGANRAIEKLLIAVSALMARPREGPAQRGALVGQTWGAAEAMRASRDLRRLSGTVRTVGGVLVPGSGPSAALLASLREIHATFDSVARALAHFQEPLRSGRRIVAKRYLEMERGTLVEAIRGQRGHCSRIAEHYIKSDGIRDWLAAQPGRAKLLRAADDAFARLGTGDNDLFAALAGIGDVLTTESRVIAGLLLTGRQEAAKKRILAGRRKLAPLERSLHAAMRELQDAEGALGYVPDRT